MTLFKFVQEVNNCVSATPARRASQSPVLDKLIKGDLLGEWDLLPPADPNAVRCVLDFEMDCDQDNGIDTAFEPEKADAERRAFAEDFGESNIGYFAHAICGRIERVVACQHDMAVFNRSMVQFHIPIYHILQGRAATLVTKWWRGKYDEKLAQQAQKLEHERRKAATEMALSFQPRYYLEEGAATVIISWWRARSIIEGTAQDTGYRGAGETGYVVSYNEIFIDTTTCDDDDDAEISLPATPKILFCSPNDDEKLGRSIYYEQVMHTQYGQNMREEQELSGGIGKSESTDSSTTYNAPSNDTEGTRSDTDGEDVVDEISLPATPAQLYESPSDDAIYDHNEIRYSSYFVRMTEQRHDKTKQEAVHLPNKRRPEHEVKQRLEAFKAKALARQVARFKYLLATTGDFNEVSGVSGSASQETAVTIWGKGFVVSVENAEYDHQYCAGYISSEYYERDEYVRVRHPVKKVEMLW